MSEKQKIYGLISAIVLVAGVFLYAVWNTGAPQQERKASQSGLPLAGGGVPAGEHPTLSGQRGLQLQEEGKEAPTGFQKLTETVLKPFTSLVLGGDGSTAPLVTQKQASQEEISIKPKQNQSIRPLSEEEIFDRLWPPSYRDYLALLENIMAGDGFVKESEKHPAITSDEDVYAVLLKVVDYVEKKEWVVPEDAQKLRHGIGVDLKNAIDGERVGLRAGKGVSTTLPLPRDQRVATSWQGARFFVEDIVDGLKYIISVREAQAGWYVTPDCYKDDIPIYPVPGFNGWSFCCDCGFVLVCGPDSCTCVFEEHCGRSCTCYPLGCLNAVCALWPNAIWDDLKNPFGTGICGCG